MTKILKYKFELESTSPLMVSQEVMTYGGNGEYTILGNSIAGAIRDYLENQNFDIKAFMGGSLTRAVDTEQLFIDSNMKVSDLKINNAENAIKEGTAIDSQYGAAKDGQKYSIDYIKPGAKLEFYLECETNEKISCSNIKNYIRVVASAFENGSLRIGGDKNNDNGKLKVIKLFEKVWNLDSIESIDGYLNSIHDFKDFGEIEEKEYKDEANNSVDTKIKIEGRFPFGVYQGFSSNDNSYTSIIDGKIPASSVKGLFRHEVERIINTFLDNKDEVKRKIEEILGGTEKIGKIRFESIKLQNHNQLKPFGSEDDEYTSTYIKIDRLTGGTIDKALRLTKEYYGDANINMTLSKDFDKEKYLFPLLIVINNICIGQTPIGGRTSSGFGEYEGKLIEFGNKKDDQIIINKDLVIDGRKLEEYFESFKGWCEER